jgi:hypothetical protein
MPHLWRKNVQLLHIHATYTAIFSIFMFFKNSARKNMVNFATFSPHMCSSCTFFRHFLSISRTNVRKKLKIAHYFRRGERLKAAVRVSCFGVPLRMLELIGYAN